METDPYYFLLFAAIIVFNEYAWKALFEGWTGRYTASSPLRVYAVYRLMVFFFHTVMLAFLFPSPLSQTILTAGILTLLGCSELITAWISNWVYLRTKRTLRPIHLIYITVLATGALNIWNTFTWQTGTISTLPESLDLNDTLRGTVVYLLASIPANYVIRWLVNKPEDATLADMVMSPRPPMTHFRNLSESLASATSESYPGPTLKGGRIIGVLERWIVIALLTRGEMSAIGFVFAAKSIVRYHDFSKPDFAEYYLIGTLYSVLIAMGLSTLL